jgi:hypothetical protein
MLSGWKKLKNHPDPCVRSRVKREYSNIRSVYAAAVRAMKIWYGRDNHMHKESARLLNALYDEFGLKTRIIAEIRGPVFYLLMKREQKKLANGWTYEPPTSYKKNTAAWSLEQTDKDDIKNGRKTAWVVPIKESAEVTTSIDVN